MFESKFRNINVLRAIYRPKYRILKPKLMVGVWFSRHCKKLFIRLCTLILMKLFKFLNTFMNSFETTLNCHLHLKNEMTVAQKPTNVVLRVPSHLAAVVG